MFCYEIPTNILQASDYSQMTVCVLYRIIQPEEDHHYLQQDLNCIIIIHWTKQWQMN